MPSITIPLVGPYNQRQQSGISTTIGDVKDQRFINCIINVAKNNITNSANVYVEKRGGLSSKGVVSAASVNTNIYKSTGGNARLIIASGASNSTIRYADSSLSTNVDCGTITGLAYNITEGYLGPTLFFFIRSSDGTAWFLSEDAANDSTPTFTADTTSGSAVLSNVSSITNAYVGQAISGTGIPAGARIQSIDSATQITMTGNATANGTGVTVTFTRVAKIISANFPSSPTGDFVVVDGYVLIAETTNRRIYNSALNDPATWGASDYLTFGANADFPVGLFRYKNQVGCLGRTSMEFFYNAGNPSGSILARSDQLTNKVGCSPAAQSAYTQCGDKVFFIGGDSGQNRGVFTLSGFTPQKISSAAMDRNITGYFGFNIYAFNMSGYTYIYLGQTATPNRNFLICLELDIELEVEFGISGRPIIAGGRSDVTAAQDNQGIYLVSDSTDELYQLRDDIYQDDSSAFTLTIQTSKLDFETGNRKTFNRITLIGSDTQSSGTATLAYSDDDYATWVTAGTFDLTINNPEIHRCGSHKGGRAWRITHTANTAFRARALKFDYEVGAH